MHPPSDLRGKIAQLIYVRVGSNMPPLTPICDDMGRVEGILREYPIGGLLLFNGGWAADCQQTLQKAQDMVDVPMLVMSDIERGSGQQIRDHQLWPHALAFDRLGDDAAAAVQRYAELSALQARSVGIHASLSPVADIHRNPANPIIATRAYGTTTERVTELAAAYVRGCHAGGLACCAKHFPGHGNTVEDSHAALARVDDAREILDETDLKPFRDLLPTGVEMVMTAHVAYPALDKTMAPATLSYPILTELLRDEWGFDGVVISDSFKMEGVRVGSELEVTIAAILAGVDLLLDITDVGPTIEGLYAACQNDPKLMARVEEAFQRSWQLKTRAWNMPYDGGTMDQAGAAEHAAHVASTALSVVSDRGEFDVPVSPDTQIMGVLVNPYGDGAYTHTDALVQAWNDHPQINASFVLTNDTQASEFAGILEAARNVDSCLVALVLKPAAWQSSALPSQLMDLVDQITQQCPTVVASLGMPEPLQEFPSAKITLTTYSDVAPAQLAVMRWFFG